MARRGRPPKADPVDETQVAPVEIEQEIQPVPVPVAIAEYIKRQVGVDLTPYTTETTRKFGGGVVLDWKHMPRKHQTRIISAINAPYCPYRMEWWSAWQNVIYRRNVED